MTPAAADAIAIIRSHYPDVWEPSEEELRAMERERAVRRRLWETDLGRWRPRVERQ